MRQFDQEESSFRQRIGNVNLRIELSIKEHETMLLSKNNNRTIEKSRTLKTENQMKQMREEQVARSEGSRNRGTKRTKEQIT